MCGKCSTPFTLKTKKGSNQARLGLLKEVYIGTKRGIIKLGYSPHRPILSWLFPLL
jgi:hypothetical protein